MHHPRWKRPVLILSTALAAMLPITAVTTAQASPAAHATGPQPTIVFVHGAFADASGFNAEISSLRRLGYPVIAPPDQLRSLTGDADYVRSVLTTITGPIVLVGHSYGGAVITNAARGIPNVKALVYLGAYLPDKGESLATILPPANFPGSLLGPDTLTVRPAPNPYATGGQDADVYINPADFRAVFAADVPAGTAAGMAAAQRPLSATAQTQPSGDPAWKTIPSWDLITLNDKAIPPAGQRYMAARAKAHIETVRSSHAVMVSHPTAVIRIILDAVRSLSK